MKNILTLAVLILMAIPLLAGDRFKPAIDKERQQNYQDFMECYYILTEIKTGLNIMSLKEKIEILYPKMITGYQEFLKRRPDSFLADEIKIFIAELYMFGGMPFESDKLSPDFDKIIFDADWKSKANPLLSDVIKNYPRNKRFSLVEGAETSECSAAIAMWYLGVWNNNPHFLVRLILEYPTSEYAVPAAGIIREMGKAHLLIGNEKSKGESDG